MRHLKRSTILVTFVAITLVAVSFAWSGPVGGGGGASGGGGGGGHGGGRTGNNKPKEPPKKRNQQTPPDAAAQREKLATALEKALANGTANAPFLIKLFDDASTGPLPASVASRKALADAVGTAFKGKKLPADQAKALAEPIAAGVNIDGIAADDLTAKKTALGDALAAAGASDEQKTAITTAHEKVTADQQDEPIKAVATSLEGLQAEGSISDEQKKTLTESLSALATGDAKPDDASITKLTDHLGKGLDNAQLVSKERAELAHQFRAAFNSAATPMKDFQMSLTEVKAALKAGVVPQADVTAITNDLTAIHQSMASGAKKDAATKPAGATPAATKPADAK
jgi:hypothetical protein